MEIQVFQTVSGATLASLQPEIQGVIEKTLPGSRVLISSAGTVYLTSVGSASLQTLDNDEHAFEYLRALLAGWNKSFSRNNAFREAGVPPLFPKELSIRSATTTRKGNKEKSFSFYFDIRKKPSSREKSVPVLNAEMRATLSSSGEIGSLFMAWKPIIRTARIQRLPFRLDSRLERQWKRRSQAPDIRYYFNAYRQFVIPLYRIATGEDTYYLPATRYFI